MSEFRVQCPLCQGNTELGYLPDWDEYHHRRPMQWVAGQPEPAFFTGLKIANHDRRLVQAYRCTQCGYLMLFAYHPSMD